MPKGLISRRLQGSRPTPVSIEENRRKRRNELIAVVKQAFEVSGNALTELRDDGHWKDTHTSWVAFCKETFGISKTKLFNLLKYTEIVGSLSKDNQPKITNLEQALALSKLPENDRDGAVERAERNGGITAENLRFNSAKPARNSNVTNGVTETKKTVPIRDNRVPVNTESKTVPSNTSNQKASTAKKDNEIVWDEVGSPIPNDALKYWVRSQEVQDLLTVISRAKTKVEKACADRDCLWIRVGQNGVEFLSRSYSTFKDALPYAVCLVCQGNYSMQPDGCNACGNTGLMSEYRFNHFLPKEIRELRLRQVEEIARENPDSPLNHKASVDV